MTTLKTVRAMALLAAGAAVATGALAGEAATQPSAAPGTASNAVPDALTVVRDRTTGELRAPTAAELEGMRVRAEAAAAVRQGGTAGAAPQQPLLRSHASGARSARLTADFANQSVAAKRADGSLDQTCVQGQDAAMKALTATPVAQRNAPAATE